MNEPGLLAPTLPAQARSGFWAETRATFLLATPIIFGQLIQNSLGVIDTLMVGQVSVEAVAAASLAGALFVVPLVFGFGVMGPFPVLISGSSARGDTAEGVHHLRRGLAVCLAIGAGLAVLITMTSGYLDLLHQPPGVLAQARTFLLLLTWSIVPMYLSQTLKQYCEALHTAWPPMLILSGGVFLNVGLNWIFIFGHLGAPALGLIGAGLGTLITRTVIFVALAFVVYRLHFTDPVLRHAFRHGTFRWMGYRELLALGLPSGCQVILDVGAFTFAAIMMGWISEAALAAHQVAMCVASTTFTVPLGLSMAVAIRMSHAIGSNDPQRARSCALGSLVMTLSFMTVTAITICAFSHSMATWFIHDPKVILLAAQVLLVAGLFQIFDGTQIVCSGALRGLHDVAIPTLANFSGYWLIGLPISYLLAFPLKFGAVGIWWGLLAGLGIVAIWLSVRLHIKTRHHASGV